VEETSTGLAVVSFNEADYHGSRDAFKIKPSETNDNMCLGAILRSSFDDQDRLDLPDLTRAQVVEVAQLSAHVDAVDCKFQRQFGNFMRDPGLYVGVTELSAVAWKKHLQVYVFTRFQPTVCHRAGSEFNTSRRE
jgi:hypothetical protein